MEMIYLLDLLGTVAFAVGGAYKAKSAKLNIFGVILLGILTAIGGGTIRDLILGRTPLFYLNDPAYLIICLIVGVFTYFLPNVLKKTYSIFRFTDSIGIATFAIIGVSICYEEMAKLNGEFSVMIALSCMLLGTLTAVGGGIIRDGVMGDVPYALKKGSNYVSSAVAGSVIYFVFMFLLKSEFFAIMLSFSVTLILREVLSSHGLYRKIIMKKNGSSR